MALSALPDPVVGCGELESLLDGIVLQTFSVRRPVETLFVVIALFRVGMPRA